MKSNNSNGQLTAQINVSDHKKSGFDLSNNVLGTGKIGRIIPTRALHVMPGDTIKADSKVAVQFEPLAVPILANMDVKQEHFYVPYNIVWKNWDKFISGGEKMDYQGVVPNVSMRQIIGALYEQMETYQCSVSTPVIVTTDQRANHLKTSSDADSMVLLDGDTLLANTIINPDFLGNFGDAYQAKDLLKPQFEVLDLIREFRQTSYAGDEPLFYFSAYSENAGLRNLRNMLAENPEIFNNKYTQELVPALERWIRDEEAPVAVPTNYGVQWLQLVYEYYKPFIGIGSNLDYLNMARITFTDFLYLYVYYLSWNEGDFTLEDMEWVNPFSNLNSLTTIPMSILHLRANYNIWYNNYRDILLEANAKEPIDGDVVSNEEIVTLLFPRQRCWEKDAFTTALDNPGTGNVGVPVGSQNNSYDFYTQLNVSDLSVNNDSDNVYKVSIDGKDWRVPTAYLTGINGQDPDIYDSVVGFSLYSLDAAQRAQKWLQKALFYGNRINDFYNIRFGVKYLDARLRLPELLTSSSELVKIDVLMNNTTTSESIAGDRAGFASAYDNGNSFDRFCEEHGVIMSYLTIMPQVTYAYGMSRDYSRLDQFDFAFPEFATLGMDAVYDSEISSVSTNVPHSDVQVFGYQGKYYDYKAKHSEEHGELLDSQDMYTFARKFNMYDPNGRPKLNYEFVHCFPDLDMFVVDSTLADYFRYDIRHSTAAERELPVHSIYI